MTFALNGDVGDRRYEFIDGIRAVAAVAVLLNHARALMFVDWGLGVPQAYAPLYFLSHWGHQAVVVFFVVSGFWIASAVQRREGAWSWVTYGRDRLTRLWLVLLPALSLGLLLDSVGRFGLNAPIYQGGLGSSVIRGDVAEHLSVLTWIGNAAFLQNVAVAPLGSNGALWSLANEAWYYLWFPALYLVARRRVHWGFALLALASMIPLSGLLPLFPCWLFGASVYFLHRRVKMCPLEIWIISIVAFGLALTYAWFRPGIVADWACALALGAFLLTSLARNVTLPLGPVARFGAGSSYSLYAIHLPLVAFALSGLQARLHPSLATVAMFGGLCSAVVGVAWLFSRVTEARTGAVRDWFARPGMKEAA